EQADGYLGVVSNSGQAADIAAQINAARRAEYQKVANSSGASLADVEAMAGKKAMEKTPAGQYVQVGGKWVKK
ncbi:YdbL family protein, partial [Pseudomonas aeruginosa]